MVNFKGWTIRKLMVEAGEVQKNIHPCSLTLKNIQATVQKKIHTRNLMMKKIPAAQNEKRLFVFHFVFKVLLN